MVHPTRRTFGVCAVLLSALIAMGGCSHKRAAAVGEPNSSGDIPDSIQYVPFTPPGMDYQVSTPEGWARADASGAIVFTDHLNSITIESHKATTAPTVSSARASEVPLLQKRFTAFTLVDVTEVQRKAGPAALVTFHADSAADAVTGKVIHQSVERYLFFHNRELVTLTLAGPSGADNVDPWRTVTDSLHWL